MLRKLECQKYLTQDYDLINYLSCANNITCVHKNDNFCANDLKNHHFRT